MTTRLLQIVPSLEFGGPQKQMVLLSARLPRDDFNVRVLSLGGDGPLSDELRDSRVTVLRAGRRHHIVGRAVWSLNRSIRDFAPDIVHTWASTANVCGRAAAIRANVPHIIASTRSLPCRRSLSGRMADRFLARWTDQYIVSTRQVRDACVQQGLPPDKMTVIPNGVAGPNGSGLMSRADLLRTLRLPDDAKIIGAVGPLQAEKRIKDLIWAADLLKVIRDDVYLLIIGQGPHAWRLRRFRDQVRIRDRVLFLGNRPDLQHWMGHLDCIWLANLRESLGNALLEAMSAGVPVVATDTPGNRDAIVPGETGLLVPIGDRGGFAKQTQKLLQDPELARQLGRAGQLHVQGRFDVNGMVQRYIQLYRQLAQA